MLEQSSVIRNELYGSNGEFNINNPEQAQRIAQQFELDQDWVGLARFLGFKSLNEYEQSQKMIAESFEALNSEFTEFMDLTIDTRLDLISQSVLLLNSSPISGSLCGARLNNCMGIANGNFVIAQAGCVALVFVPFVGPGLGVACTMGNIVVHDAAMSNCGFDYAGCNAQK